MVLLGFTHETGLIIMANYYFVIVGKNDTPVFECDFGPEHEKVGDRCCDAGGLSLCAPMQKEEQRHNQQFAVHSALDTIDEAMWSTPSMCDRPALCICVCPSHVSLLLSCLNRAGFSFLGGNMMCSCASVCARLAATSLTHRAQESQGCGKEHLIRPTGLGVCYRRKYPFDLWLGNVLLL